MTLVKFNNEDLHCSFEALTVNETYYFKAKEVATSLGYKNPQQAIRVNVDEDDRVKLEELGVLQDSTRSLNEKNAIYINESGFYSLILRSDKPEIKQFKRWVTSEVLPKLRQTGNYTINTNILELKNETVLHYRVVQYVNKYYPDVVVTAGLGEMQDTSIKRIDAKRKGYTAGTNDITIAVPNAYFTGFAIELKNPRGTGVLSDNQKKYLNKLQLHKYKTLVSHDYDEIVREIIEYMRTVKYCCPYCQAINFKSMTCLQNHIRIMHNINPDTMEKQPPLTSKQVYVGETPFLLDRNALEMFKITHETSRKYHLHKVKVASMLTTTLAKDVEEVELVFSPNELMRECEVKGKHHIDNNNTYKRYTHDDVHQVIFRYYSLVTMDGVEVKFKEKKDMSSLMVETT